MAASHPMATGPRLVLITGAAGGLGKALVGAFAEAGWKVAAAGHRTLPDRREGVAWTGQVEVGDAVSVARMFAEVDAAAGPLDVLINNAGVAQDELLARLSDAAWDRVVNASLRGAFLCSRESLARMVPRGRGQILNIASLAARTGAVGQAHYAAAKAGLIGLTLSLAREVGGAGIAVNAVLPGVLATPMTDGLSREVLEGFAAASVWGCLNTPEAAARWIVALAEGQGVSGQVWALDGRVSRWC